MRALMSTISPWIMLSDRERSVRGNEKGRREQPGHQHVVASRASLFCLDGKEKQDRGRKGPLAAGLSFLPPHRLAGRQANDAKAPATPSLILSNCSTNAGITFFPIAIDSRKNNLIIHADSLGAVDDTASERNAIIKDPSRATSAPAS